MNKNIFLLRYLSATHFGTLLFTFMFSLSSQATSYREYKAISLEQISKRYGVQPTEFDQFQKTIERFAKQGTLNETESTNVMANCLSKDDRSLLLTCLSSHVSQKGSAFLASPKALQMLLEKRNKLDFNHLNEFEMNFNLLNYIGDISRSLQTLHPVRKASWVMSGPLKNELAPLKKEDFKFQDGDVLLGMGNSSISSVISQVTTIRLGYSHAFIVRVAPDGTISTIESLLETGVKQWPFEHFVKDPYNKLTVLRLKKEFGGDEIKQKASQIAKSFADNKIPYDFAMDLNDNQEKIFCNEVVMAAYARALGLSFKDMFPVESKIRSEASFQFVAQYGVENRNFVSPSDIIFSPLFEVVAEYRPAQNLTRHQELVETGEVFLEKVEEGYRLHPGPFTLLLPPSVWMLQLFPGIVFTGAKVIPHGISPYQVSLMITQELAVYKKTIRFANDNHPENGLTVYNPSAFQALERMRIDEDWHVGNAFH